MENNNWRASQAQAQAQVQAQSQSPVQGGEAAAGTGSIMNSVDWRINFKPEARQRIIIKIMDSLRKHMSTSQHGGPELQGIADKFEEKIYITAISQPDYLRRISSKLLAMDKKTQAAPVATNPLQTDTLSTDSGSQIQNQGQPMMAANLSQGQNQQQSMMGGNQLQGQNQQQTMTGVNQSQGRDQQQAIMGANYSQGQNQQQTVMGVNQSQGQNQQQEMMGANPSQGQNQHQALMGANKSQGQNQQQSMRVANQSSQGQKQRQAMRAANQTQGQAMIRGNQSQGPQPPMANQGQQQAMMVGNQSQMQNQGQQQAMMGDNQLNVQNQRQAMIGGNQSQARQQQQMPSQNNIGVASSAMGTVGGFNQAQTSMPTVSGQSVSVGGFTQNQTSMPSVTVGGLTQTQTGIPNVSGQNVTVGSFTQSPTSMNNMQNIPNEKLQQGQGGMASNVFTNTQQQQRQMQQLGRHQQQYLYQQQHQLQRMQAARQQQQQQTQPQQSPMIQQQTKLATKPQQQQQQQQQQIIGQQQQQIIGQQPNVTKMEQQPRVIGQQQMNLSNMHHQKLVGTQGNPTGLQNHQVMGVQPHLTSSAAMLGGNQQPILRGHQHQHMQQQQQTGATLLPNQPQQLHLPQQHLNSQPILHGQQQIHQSPTHLLSTQPQPPQLQQQHPNALQRNQQQRMQTSPLNQNVVDQKQQQQQLFQAQRSTPTPEAPSTSLDSTAETGGDWQEEAYQKVKSMKEKYFPQLHSTYQKIAMRMQNYNSLTQQPGVLERLKCTKFMIEKLLQFLSLKKNEMTIANRDKILPWERQISAILCPKSKSGTSIQQGQSPLNQNQNQQPQSQIQENQMNTQVQQPIVVHSPMNNPPNLQQHNNNSPSPASNLSNPLQQKSMSHTQQMNVNQLSSQTGVNILQPNINPLQTNPNIIQQPNIDPALQTNPSMIQHSPQQKMLRAQQMKHRQMQHLHQRQHLMQQRQIQLSKQKQQQQLLNQQKQNNQPQILQMENPNQQTNVSPVILQQNPIVVPGQQRSPYQQQQSKSTSSSQVPKVGPTQIDQQNMQKAATPLQSSSSSLIAPSPSTPLAPSPMPVDSSLPSVPVVTQPLAIGTPGVSASPFLAELTSDPTQIVASVIVSDKSDRVESPHERLMKAVRSMSSKALSAAVSDISSVVSMVDVIAGLAPGNGSRVAISEDLATKTKSRLHVRDYSVPYSSPESKKMRRFISAIPSYVGGSSASSVNDSLRQLNGYEASDLKSTASSHFKGPNIQAYHALLEEIRDINSHLVDTVLEISNEDPITEKGVAEGTIVKCSYSAVSLSPNLKSHYASAQMLPIKPLRLLVPNNYPNSSPVILDEFIDHASKEYEDLSIKVKSRFNVSVRKLSQPMLLEQIANTWDDCVRTVICEYAQQRGGGSFSTKYGGWLSG